jgi:hypothetical protein
MMRGAKAVEEQGSECTSCKTSAASGKAWCKVMDKGNNQSEAGSRVIAQLRLSPVVQLRDDSYMTDQLNTTQVLPWTSGLGPP